MRCPECAFENRQGVRFCEMCGAGLGLVCPGCGASLPPDRRFCGECGAALSPAGESPPAAPAAPAPDRVAPEPSAPAREAERRQLTVAFCDLAGSTALANRLDLEDMREVIAAFQDKCRVAVERYGGFIARYMGDGALVYFGYPRAHEDDAARAARAGLAVVGSMAELDAGIGRRHAVTFQVRVGVATGPVVVGDIVGEGAASEAMVVGETPNLAARLQAAAEPGQVLVAPATRRLLGSRFECEHLGTRALKGIDRPVALWRVVCEREPEGIEEAPRIGGRLPLVGRQEELGLLLRSWQTARERHGQAVLIQGEAGIGKSRLIEALRERMKGEDFVWIMARCSPYHSSSPLYPAIEHLKRVMRFKSEDDSKTRLEKLEESLQTQSLPLKEVVPLYAELMSVPLPEGRYPALSMTPQQKREATLDAVSGWLLELAEQTPVLQVWEDLHWADPTTLELLRLYLEQSPTVSMLNVFTYRPEFVPPWPAHSHVTPITLNRLERAEVQAIVANLAGGKSVPEEVVKHVLAKADGVPLYVEELTKTILESGVLEEGVNRYRLKRPLEEVQIPSTLQDSLMARLDRAPVLREVAQMGAVIGREFGYEMLASLAARDDPVLQHGLGQLVTDELLYQRGRGHRARYFFKHALIQDAAYGSLLRRTRQHYHRRVAEHIKEKLPDTAEAQPELLAHHYSEAGCHQEAVEYWRAAGRIAAKRSANVEAVVHFKRGLGDLQALAETTERDRAELEIQTALGPALIATGGYGAPEVRETYARALALCARAGSDSDTFHALRGLWNSYLFAAEMPATREHGEALLRLAERIGDDTLIVEAHRVMATVSFFMGEFLNARRHARAGIEVYDPARHRDLALVYGADPGVICGLYGALASWMLGYPDEARSEMDAAVARSQALSLAHTEAFARAYQAVLYQFNRQPDQVEKSAKTAIEVASRHRIRQWSAWATLCHGWAEFMAGEQARGMNQMCQGYKDWTKMGNREFLVPFIFALTSEALAVKGKAVEALNTAAEALKLSSKTSERFFAAELNRLSGEFLLQMGEPNEAEAEKFFVEALDVARAQQAKSLELRAAVSLCRLWRRQGKDGPARELLGGIYGWFSEGFDTADLKQAGQLMEALRAAAPAVV